MNDRELLELAAKAYADPTIHPGRPHFTRWIGCDEVLGCDVFVSWDPLSDDGDALRLAVSLRIDVSHDEVGMKSFVYAITVANDYTHIGLSEVFDDEGERLERTRRAVVRIAAEIGKGL